MKSLIGLAFLFVINISFAGVLKTEEDTRGLADKMMDQFIKKEFQKGIDLAKPNWPLPEVELDGLINLISTQWPVVDQRYGQALGVEFVREERIGSSFIRYYYLHKFQNHAIYWKFTFFKPNDTWVVNGVSYDDSLDVLYRIVE